MGIFIKKKKKSNCTLFLLRVQNTSITNQTKLNSITESAEQKKKSRSSEVALHADHMATQPLCAVALPDTQL